MQKLLIFRSVVRSLCLTLLLLFTPLSANAQPTAGRCWAYIGNTSSDGIGLFKLDTTTGTLTPAGIAAAAVSPEFLAVSPNQKFLYSAITLKTAAGNVGGIQAFSIDTTTGKLTTINNQPLGRGDDATFVTVDPSGRNVLIASYGSARVMVVPADPATGRLSPVSCAIKESGSSIDPHRQTRAYAHSINCDPSGRFAISCDLGADKLFLYKLDSGLGKLTPNDPPSVSVAPGSGPRHLTFSPDGKFVYVITEMGATVIAYSFDESTGSFKEIQTTKLLKEDVKGNTSAEVQIDPTGRFLYASNRGSSTNYLTIFSIDKETGQLTLAGYQDSLGKFPRGFRIDPTGKYLLAANQNSNTLVLFAIDRKTGLLTAVGQPVPTVHGPICVKFVPAG